MTATCRKCFYDARAARLASRPFTKISAYKVRESLVRLQYEQEVVGSMATYLRAPNDAARPWLLKGCTPKDMDARLERVPFIIAEELGGNLLPAIEALVLEGVPKQAISSLLASIRPRVVQLIHDCDDNREATLSSVPIQRLELGAGFSIILSVCRDAVSIASDAAEFCLSHGVLRPQQ